MYFSEIIEEEKREAAKQAAEKATLQTLLRLAKKMIKAGKNTNKEISEFLSLPYNHQILLLVLHPYI